MKDSNYYQIAGWMGNHLHLRGNDLICFAVIYGFSQDGESQFKGKLEYLADCMYSTKQTAHACVHRLINMGYIAVEEVMVKGKKYCHYSSMVDFENGEVIFRDRSKTFNGTIKESLTDTVQNSLTVYKHNNNIYNNNIDNNFAHLEDFEEFYKIYPLKKSKATAIKAWKKLSPKDRKEAIDKLPQYIADCAINHRNAKYPATYLNQRTWEDEFGEVKQVKVYDIMPTDSEMVQKFKAYMRGNFPEIEETRIPLCYEHYMELVKQAGVDIITECLQDIEREIWKYRKSDIAQVIKERIKESEL